MRLLPNPALYVRLDSANLKLVVDDVTQAYKIFRISADVSSRPSQAYCMCIYNSTTDRRRFSTNPPLNLSNDLDKHVRSAVYEGVLYVFFYENRPAHGLYSYNDFADFREDTGVKFGQDRLVMIEYCDLMASKNRLFLINQSLTDLSRLDESMVDQRDWPGIINYADYWSK